MNRYLRGRRPITRLMAGVVLILLLIVAHRYVLGIACLAYALLGFASWSYLRLRPSASRSPRPSQRLDEQMNDEAREPATLDYAQPRPRPPTAPRSLNKRGWIAIHAGYSLAIMSFVGLMWNARSLDDDGFTPATAFGLLFMLGCALCVAGIVLVAIAASRPQ